MQRAAIIIIFVAIVVLLGGYWLVNQTASTNEQAPLPEADPSTLRTTTSGNVVGFIDTDGARAWLGIPFAQAPVADLRWRAPKPYEASPATMETIAPGPVCIQKPSQLAGEDMEAPSTGSEDCLYLNVWSPPNASKLPVMYWIHGGGNTVGDGGSYSGARLAAAQDVVVVTINYRLGLFGWFVHPALARGNPLDDSGNYAVLDMIQGLAWVRDNIAEFGGDPDNVTVFGESAGAADTLAMMASPLAEGLFHRAIVQSGGFNPATMQSIGSYIEEGGHENSGPEIVNKLLVSDGQVGDRDAARSLQEDMAAQDIREYLYGKSADEIYGLFPNGGFGMINTPDLVGDGHVLPALTTAEIFGNADNHNMVPVILGTNRDEPTLFISRDPRYVDNLFGIFYSLKDEDAYRRTVHYQASAWKARGVDELALLMTQAGNKDVYAYRWDWDEEPSLLGYDLSVALGAAHALEIPFVFGDFEGGIGVGYVYPNDENQAALSKSMMSYWSEFAYSGNPGQGRDGQETAWLRWGEDDKTSIILDTPSDQGIFMSDMLVTHDRVQQELAADTTFTDERERCELYVRMFMWGGNTEEDYNRFADGACQAYDPNSFSQF